MSCNANNGWALLLDFDGTVTFEDTDAVVAERTLPAERLATFSRLIRSYEALEIGLVAYFEQYLELVALPPEELQELAAEVPARPGAAELVRFCNNAGIEVRIVSEGIDLLVEPAAKAAGLAAVPISCNRARREDGRWRLEPAAGAEPCPRCLSCKGALVRRLRAEGQRVVVVGDGASDLCGAREADLVLGRGSLAKHCQRESIPHHLWETFDDVRRTLNRNIGRGCRA